jgi:predicted AlkP superfamily pyrophosphatase or phosphodiesterase
VLISLDGVRWDDPDRARAPTLSRLAREGATARLGLEPPFPASTFPSHATLATGVYADRHGIVNNEFLDRVRGVFRRDDDASWLLAEPSWATAERQGVRTAVDGWVCASSPWHGIAAAIQVPFARRVSDSAAIERLLAWLKLPEDVRPALILTYLSGVDGAGHAGGPGTAGVHEALRQSDRLVGRVLREVRALKRAIALVIVSDHGMAAVRERIDVAALLRGRASGARVIPSGATANVYCASRQAACEQAEDLLRRRVPGLEIYRQQDLPAELRYRQASRTGDLVAIAPAGIWFGAGEDDSAAHVRGMHGYRPTEREMRGVVYAWGAGVRPGARIELARAVDIDPFVCRLLGIAPPAGLDGETPDEWIRPVTRDSGTPLQTKEESPARTSPPRERGGPL